MPSNYNYTGSGGISVGGPQHYTLDIDYEAVSGGLVFGGSADCSFNPSLSDFVYVGSGGISVSGPGEIVDYEFIAGTSGKIALGGGATYTNPNQSSYVYVGSGGISVSGPNEDITDYAYCGDPGTSVSLGGSADYTNSNVVNGQVNYVYEGSGGIAISSPQLFLLDYAYCAVPGTSITLGGSAQVHESDVVVTTNYTWTGTGGIVVSGTADETSASYVYNMSGGIQIAGSSELHNEIYIDVGIGWNTFAIVTVDIAIGWNTGETPVYFYRVEGVCQPIECPPVSDPDPANKHCNYSFIQNIAASNVCDVCTQLANNRFLKTIKSIKVFSNPAKESDIESAEALGKIDPTCNTLTPVDFCQCPPCAQFCDYEGVTQGLISTTTTQTTTVVDGYTVTYELVVIKNRQGIIIEEYYYPIYTPDYVTLITTTTTTKPGYTVLTTGRVRMGGEAIVSWKPTEIPLVATTGSISTSCGCNVPTEIYFSNDLIKTSKLGDFLKKNAFKLPTTNTLIYSRLNQAWYTNISYTGTGLDGTSREKWSIILKLECTNIVDGVFDPGNSFYWKLTIMVRQHNLTQNKNFDTRLLINMTDGGPCERGELNVSAYFNVRTLSVLPIDPPNIAISATLSDKIGLFQSPSWFSNPKFFIGLTVDKVTSNNDNIEFGPLYPEIEVSRLN